MRGWEGGREIDTHGREGREIDTHERVGGREGGNSVLVLYRGGGGGYSRRSDVGRQLEEWCGMLN